MSLYTLPGAGQKTLVVGDFAQRTAAEFAAILTEHKANYYLVVGEAQKSLEPYADRVITQYEDIPQNIEVIIDLNWPLSFSGETIDILESEIVGKDTLILTTCVNATATEAMHHLSEYRVMGFNGLPGFFPHVKRIELAPPLGSSPDVTAQAVRYFSDLGFEPEVVEDRIGYVLPRIMSMIINEAAFSVMEGVASPADIDTAMKLGTNYPRGPLEWADDIGLDTVRVILDSLLAEYGQERYRPCVLLRQYERAGWIGKEAGRGFYHYNEQGERIDA